MKFLLKSKKIHNEFEPIGIAHGSGVDNMSYVLASFSLSSARECLIVSDNDSAANKGQEKHSREKQFGVWKKYSDIDKNVLEINRRRFCS